jgi:hypothetical protein
MADPDERKQVGKAAGVHHRPSQSGTAAPERVFGGGESHLRSHLPSQLRLSDPQRSTLAEIGKRLGRKALAQVACVAKPNTILGWYRKLVAQKFDGSKHHYPGRPAIEPRRATQPGRSGDSWSSGDTRNQANVVVHR